MKQARRSTPDLEALVHLFHPSLAPVGEFEEVEAGELREAYHTLLDHDEHMTVAMECYYGEPVDVLVLDTHITETHYARKSWLTRRSDGRVVQFCIVRLNLMFLERRVRREIESQLRPLGRILIDHNVLRHVRLLSLWRIRPGPELRHAFRLDQPVACYGRTALIYCNEVPAVELLEVAAPVDR